MDEPRRDDVFDRELRRALAAEGGAAAGPHVDAELAAAWMDRQLDPTATRAVEAHLAGCHDCQLVMATLARTLPDGVVAGPALAWWRRLRAGWLIPVTVAAAAALVIWVAVPQQRASRPREADTVATAPAAPAPESAAPPRDGGSPQSKDETESDRRLGAAASEPQRKAANLAQPAPPLAAPVDPPLPVPAPPPAAPSAAPPLERRERAAAIGALNETVTVAPEPPAADAQRADKQTVAGDTPAIAQERQQQQQQQQGASTARALRDAAGFAAGGRVASALAIAAPGNGPRWRRTGSTFEFAPRAGAAFSAVTLPVAIDAVTAGTAPGGTVCWLAGRGGLVLVSLDGVRFMRAALPAAVDLTAIAAVDAIRATVTAADGRRFMTADQGASWTAVP